MLRHGELRGLAGLRAAADDLYGDDVDPEARARATAPPRSAKRDGAWELVLPAPAFDKRDSPSAKTATPSSCP